MTTFETEMTTAPSAQPSDTCEAFWSAVADDASPSPISFDRCVDWLLDLYQVTDDVALRTLIADVLDDLRALGPVEGEFEDIVLGALASVEAAFDVVDARDEAAR